MLNLRRPEPKMPTPETAPAASNAEKARALIAMLEAKEGGGTADTPPEHLRDWARDLIRTVEARRPEPPTTPDQAPKNPAVRLFSKAAPRLTESAPAPVAAQPAPQVARPGVHDVPSEFVSTAAPTGSPVAPKAATTNTTLSPGDLRKLIEGAFDPATMAREHPAVIAMTLVGKPSMEQAAALRSLPSGQVRAVHKALRQMQAGA